MKEAVIIWMLVLVTPSEMVEKQAYHSRESCMYEGTRIVLDTLWEQRDEDESNPFARYSPKHIDGFFCEPQPKPQAKVELPKCTEPVEYCS